MITLNGQWKMKQVKEKEWHQGTVPGSEAPGYGNLAGYLYRRGKWCADTECTDPSAE